MTCLSPSPESNVLRIALEVKARTFRTMARIFILVLATLCASVVSAQPRQWQDGTLVKITDDAPGVASNAPETVYRYQIRRAYYWVKVGDITYVFVNSCLLVSIRRKPL